MRTLVVGSGGREHAIVRALQRTRNVSMTIFCAPGNAGISDDAQCVDINVDDTEGLVDLAVRERVDLVIVGPEGPLVNGLVDAMNRGGILAFGPSAAAARLEGSKIFAKEIMDEAGIPTAKHATATSLEQARQILAGATYPIVLKADGLAAGKGVIICPDAQAAETALNQFFVQQQFGQTSVLIEEFLHGQEVSLLAICDGVRAVPMAAARDFKRIFDGDRGPNTGGMGSFSPVPRFTDKRIDELSAIVHQPIIDTMRERGTPFHGILYAGLMMTSDGPRVLEYNTRFGDPETQSILPRLISDIGFVMNLAVRTDGLKTTLLRWRPEAAVTITLASAGYPESSSNGDPINGLGPTPKHIEVTHAGTIRRDDGVVVTAGGRVLNVTALGASVAEARRDAYEAASRIQFAGRQMRTDIASDII